MLVVGLILLLLGVFAGIPLLLWIGVALLVIGAVLNFSGGVGHPVGGRRWYY